LSNSNSEPALSGLAVLVVLGLLLFCVFPSVQSQTDVAFTSQDRFPIPSVNGSIGFLVNGSYSSATLQNGVWNFQDLNLRGSQTLGNLKVSAQNSNITISFFRSNNTFLRSSTLRYSIEGQGIQTVNLGLNTSQPTSTSEWSVIVAGNVFLAPGDGWNLLKDNTVVVTGATGNVTVSYYNFGLPPSDLPFYEQHSVAIVTVTVMAVTVLAAVLVKIKGRS
jgi:hypothetical protein